MEIFTLDEARTNLSQLLDRAAAGEEIVIEKAGTKMARLLPFEQHPKAMRLGLLEGQGYWISDNFNDPLPDDILDAFEGKTS